MTIEAANVAGISDQLSLGAITAQGDVLLRGWGSIVAASNDTTVDPDKLARFLASAKTLALDPTTAAGNVCSGQPNCIIVPSKLAVVETQVRDQARAAYDVVTRTTGQTQSVDAMDAAGKIGVINGLVGEGVTLSSTWTVTLSPTALANPALRSLALQTLHARDDALPGGDNENLSLPNDADVIRGIQAYVDKVRAPLIPLFGTAATPSTVLALTTVPEVEAAITPSGYAAASLADYNGAVATLTQIFGFVPSDRTQIGTLVFAPGYFDSRTTGAVWQQGQLDFAVPSTASCRWRTPSSRRARPSSRRAT